MTATIASTVEKLMTWRYHPEEFMRELKPYGANKNQTLFYQDIANLDIKSIILCSARGTGKTETLAVGGALWHLCVIPHFTKIPCRVLVISGSQMQSDILYDYCMDGIKSSPFIRSQVIGRPLRHETKFKYGTLKALPSSFKSTLGHRADILIIDEAVEAGNEIIKRALSIVSGSPYRRIILSSTAHEYFSLFVDIWEDPDKYGFTKHGYWSQLECDWITAEEIERLRKILDETTFRIDVLGEPTSPDTFFPLDDLKASRVEDKIKYNPDGICQLGIDWGWAPSPTVLTVAQVFGERDRLQVLYQKPFKRVSPKKMDIKIDGLMTQYSINKIIADRSHIHENQRLRERGYLVQEVKFKPMKGQIMGELRRVIMNHEIDIWEEDWPLLDELRKYTEEKRKGQDRVDSLALAIWKAQRSRGGLLIPKSGSYHSVPSAFTDTFEDRREHESSEQ